MKVYSVGQVNNYINNIISNDYLLKNITIRGEISNCKYHSMGHIYFSLKDETGSLMAVMFKSSVQKGLSFTLKDGQSVLCVGRIGVFERDGKYQLYVDEIKLDGIGKLHEEFERLKYLLNEEGLFDPDIKKPIPKYPKKVGIVTAKTGAAIKDIINVARRRNPYVELFLYPAKVQGEGAGLTVAKGIKELDALGVDTIIVGRGGGSMEDLWAFNEEVVVRAIYEAKTPIISAVGHEVDITLSDYAADLRAPTPSAASELAINDVMTQLRQLADMRNSLEHSIKKRYEINKLRLDNYSVKLQALSPMQKLRDGEQRLSDLYERMKKTTNLLFERRKNSLKLYLAKLNGLSPTAKLINGFGYIQIGDNPLKSVDDASVGDDVKIALYDGSIKAKVCEIEKNKKE